MQNADITQEVQVGLKLVTDVILPINLPKEQHFSIS